MQMIYGISDDMQNDPMSDLFDSHMDGLTEGQVAQLKDIPPGGGVSYGHRFVAMRQSRIAAIPVGYADGYNRLLTNRGDVLIHGCRAPIAGTVCMDWILADVTDIPEVQIGDRVTLLGRDGNEMISAEEWADKVGSITYEVFCGISKRVPRVYVDSCSDLKS